MARKADFWDFLFLLRPTLMMPVWMFLFYGYFHGMDGRILHPIFPKSWAFWCIFVALTAISGSAYVVNQIVDIETDRINKKLFLLPEGIIPVKAAWLVVVGLSIFGLVLGAFCGRLPFLLLLTIWIFGFLYSVRPFRFKGRPFIDLIWNALGYGLLTFALGFWAAKGSLAGFFRLSVPFMLAVGATYAETTIPDIPGDLRDGAYTTGVILRPFATALLALGLMAASFAISLIVRVFTVSIASGLSLPGFLWAAMTNDPEQIDMRSRVAFRLAGVFFALVIGIHCPIYIAIGIVVYFGLKRYYKTRFGLDYPSLRG